jgi:predicted ATPase/class 3 adenylate cyclase
MSAQPDELPTGTVTFLFTDIEGSTRLLAALRDRYDDVLARHHEIVRTTLVAHGGTEVSTEGDAFFAVFRSPPHAVAAAADAQRALAMDGWPDGAIVRVRMGLHTGEGRLGGDNYTGLDVHRAARIASAGHGGQVLLSDATRALVARDLPDGTALVDLGEHRLKDLPAPERVWQLEIDGLERRFPAVRSLDARPNNLPLARTSLVGRGRELEVVSELLGRSRLLTLTGAGGSGKTRLALAIGHRLLADFADGTYFVALEDAHERDEVVAAIAAALEVREKPDRDLEQGIRERLADRELLLILDNFEQVMHAAPLVAELLDLAPRLRVIVTSRAALHLAGEQEFEVPPLGLPDPRDSPSVEALSQYEAVALFIDRARSVRPDFTVTNENAPAVAEICSRLDGLPLAIELAAARAKLLSPQAILDRLDRRLALLTGGPADQPDRQRTLRGAIAWSFELLEEPERRLSSRLAVFAGGWTVEAAEEVCNPDGELSIDTLDGLASLVDKSLVRRVETATDQPRFGMLQVIREFAAELLDADADAADVRSRHLRHMLALAERAGPELVRSDVRRWQARLRVEEDNLRAALRWAMTQGEAESALRIGGALWRFWHYWARMREGRDWLEAALAMPGADGPSLSRAKALTALAGLTYWQGDADRTEVLYAEALELYRALGDPGSIGEALYNTAWAAVARNEPELAMQRGAAAVEQYRIAGDRVGVKLVGAWLRASPFIMGAGGSAEDALAAAHEAIDVSREHGRAFEMADWLGGVAQIKHAVGDLDGAEASARDAMRAFQQIGNVVLYPMVFQFLAVLTLARGGDPGRAVRLAAAAGRFFIEIGGELPMVRRWGDPFEQARPLLTTEAYQRAEAEGRAMSLDEAVAYALDAQVTPS